MKYNQKEFLKVQKQTAKEDIYHQATSLGETSPDFAIMNSNYEDHSPRVSGGVGASKTDVFAFFY